MSQMNRRQALRLLAALGATGLVTACSGDDSLSDDPVRIGLIIPLSGRNKAIGDEIRKGFELYLSFHGNRLGGHPVELITADEGETVDSGKAALESLLKQNVVALTGVVDSAIMLGISAAVEEAKIPLIGSCASPSSLQGVVYIWRTNFVDHELGQAIGPHVASQVRDGEVAIVAEEIPLGRDVETGFRQSFGVSDPRIAEQTIWVKYVAEPTASTYRSQIRRIIDRDPAAVFCAMSGPAATVFIKELRAAGYRGSNKRIYGSGLLTEGTVVNELGTAALGIQTALNYSADLRNAVNRRFVTAWANSESQPTIHAVASYDAAQVLDKAIRIAGKRPNSQQILLALGKVGQIDSPRGVWQFNQPRTPQQTWYLREVASDGKLLANLLISELGILG